MAATHIVLIRHAEKPDPARDIRGVDPGGRENPAELSVRGWQRSGALPRLFTTGRAFRMLPEPAAVFAAASQPRSVRPLRTVEPIAALLGKEVQQQIDGTDVDRLVAALRAMAGVALVCWRHEALATIARALVEPLQQLAVPAWDEARFDVSWLLTAAPGGYRFEQQPQLLLPDDRREPIRPDRR